MQVIALNIAALLVKHKLKFCVSVTNKGDVALLNEFGQMCIISDMSVYILFRKPFSLEFGP